jgi:UDP-GlcNAc:undecaprenyl-phosphate GlcNAc-1-phosphate transferase
MLEFLSVGFLVSAIFACAVTPLIRKWAPALGLIDLPGHRKVHVLPTPRGGGIAIFVGIFIPILALSIVGLLGEHTRFQGLQDIAAELGNDSRRLIQMSSIAIGAIVLFLTGLADDRWNLSWKFRLVLQLSVAVGVLTAGV